MPPGVKGRRTAPLEVPGCMTFRPTWEEFKDFNKYVTYMESVGAHKAGIAKVVPPKEWVPRKNGYNLEDFDLKIETPIKQHFKQVGGRGAYQTKGIIKQPTTVLEYHKLATSNQYRTPNHSSYDDLERKYWKSLSFCPPIYGCDVAESITDPDVETWNIRNLRSILNLVSEDYDKTIKGVNSPYLYFGMWKATFSWHVEDMDLHAINYLHHGAPKTWYCVPPQHGHLLEKAARQLFPNVASWCSNFMRHKTCLLAPAVLDRMGVPYQKVVQEENNAIVVFPYAYHSGFNHGFNVAESTNFALERWIEYGKRARQCDCARSRVTFSMDTFVKKFQPERYEAWKAGKDIEPHPEDPPEVAEEIRLRAHNPAEYSRMMQERLRTKGAAGRAVAAVAAAAFQEPWAQQQQQEQRRLRAETTTRTLQIYQHHELQKVRVSLTEDNLRCYRGLGQLKEFLDIDGQPDFRDLIDRGVLIHVGEEVVAAKRLREPEFTFRKVAVYRHSKLVEVEAVVDPATLELVGEQSQKLVEFLEGEGGSGSAGRVKELIDGGTFVYGCPGMIQEPNPDYVREEPEPKRLKSDEDGSSSQPVTIEASLYQHVQFNELLTLTPRRKLVGKLPSRALVQEVSGKTLEELLGAGAIIKVGVRKIQLLRSEEASAASTDDNEPDYDNSEDGEDEAFTSDEPSESSGAETSNDPDFRAGGVWRPKKKKLPGRPRRRGDSRAVRASQGAPEPRSDSNYEDMLMAAKAIATSLENLGVSSATDLAEKLGLTYPEVCETVAMIGVCGGAERVEPNSFRWNGVSEERLGTALREVYRQDDTGELAVGSGVGERVAKRFLRLVMTNRRGRRFHLPMVIHDEFTRDLGERVTRAAAVMESLGVLAKRQDYAGGLEYVGPDVDAWERRALFERHRSEFGLRESFVSLSRVRMGPDMVLPPIQTCPSTTSASGSRRPNFTRLKDWDEEKILLERERSIKYKDVTCQCGSSKVANSCSARSRVHVGFKKRSRCHNCDGCNAIKCMNCQPCLKPLLKKPCVNKVCLYPVIPYCPCYQ